MNMIYDNGNVRRRDRLMDEESARRLLREGEYGVLSLVRADGSAYGVPVSYVWDGEEVVYIHCAPEGEKLRCISGAQMVSFCVVGATNVVPDKFTTAYESIVAKCSARIGLTAEERMHALKLIVAKYSADYQTVGKKYAEKSFHRTEIIRLDIITLSGKRKRVN